MDPSTTTDSPFPLFDPTASSILRAANESIVMIDEHQTIVAMNPAAQLMFGCSPDEALGQSLERFIPLPHRPVHQAQVQRFAESGVLERAMAGRRQIGALRANGEPFPMEVTISRVDVAADGAPRRYFAALMRDLSNEHSLKDEIDHLRQRLGAVFDLAPIAIWIADHDRVVFANRAAARLLGADSGRVLQGRSVFELVGAESHATLGREIARALDGAAGGAPVHGRLACTDGPPREVEIALAALPDHGHTTVQMVVADVTQSRAEALELERSRRALRRLSASLVEAREEERRRIARELHDELGQRLTALKMDLGGLAADQGLGEGDPRVAGMLVMLDETVASLRRIAGDLRPLMLDDLGLHAAIEWLAHETARRLDIDIELQLDGGDTALDPRAAIALYRIVQEALTNVARHARASRVRIELGRIGDELRLVVCDDGVGLPARALQGDGSYGLLGMRERAHMLGGRFDVASPEAGGVRITVHVPFVPPPRP